MMPASALQPHDLRTLCAGLSVDVPECLLADLTPDSRRIVPGAGFVALAGARTHGLDHLQRALDAGAIAVLHDADDPRWSECERTLCHAYAAVCVAIPRLAREVGTLAARLWAEPARRFDSVTAVTGTDGKTSVSHFVAAMLDEPTAHAAVLGTLGCGRPGQLHEAGLTTPDAFGLQEKLAGLVGDGVRHLALEASSHGLAQYRLDGTRIDTAVLTQLGRDHLDYHPDMAAYAAAKARLFAWPGLRAAVLNADDAFGRQLSAALAPEVHSITYGRTAGALQARDIVTEATGLRFELCHADARHSVRVPLLGAFNVDNLLAAAGVLLAHDHALPEVVERIERVRAVPGRMELFRVAGRAPVIVDYAHNAGALTAALAALREHVAGRVWCIFGAGGDRDRGKRPLMGAAAVAGADRVVVTDDNPRHENADAIIESILAGMPSGSTGSTGSSGSSGSTGSAAMVERDREQALALALAQADADDAILLAGKGHEAGQIRGDEVLPYSDRDSARRLLGLAPEVVS